MSKWKSSEDVLVGGWTTHLKKIFVKLDHFPKDRGEHKKIFELPPPRCYFLKKMGGGERFSEKKRSQEVWKISKPRHAILPNFFQEKIGPSDNGISHAEPGSRSNASVQST